MDFSTGVAQSKEENHVPTKIAKLQENAHFDNPYVSSFQLTFRLAGLSAEELMLQGETFAIQAGLADQIQEFRKGALVAQNPTGLAFLYLLLTLGFEHISHLTGEDKAIFRREYARKWDQPKTLYSTVILCSVAAAVQGMDQTVINGANLFFPKDFGIAEQTQRNTWLLGLVNSAPYLCW